MNRPSKFRGFAWVPSLLFSLVALLLTGCGAAHYRSDYNGFNTAFADSSNKQMLMNLARLDQHDPAYFLSFGQISVQYQLNSSASILGNDTVPQPSFQMPIISGTASVAAGANTTPQFTFIPVTSDKVAQQLLLPLPPEDFYTLYQQGLPVDQLLRLMAERFEIQLPGTSEVSTFSNNPGRCEQTSYIVFLKICAIARALQLSGNLKLRETDSDELVTNDWTWSPAAKKSGDVGGAAGGGDDSNKTPPQPSAKDVMAAHDKGMFYKQNTTDGSWSLYKREETASFYLEGDCSEVFDELAKDPLTNQGDTLRNVRAILTSPEGFSIQGDLLNKSGATGSQLILRSFMGAMTAAAEEQTYFNLVMNKRFEANVPRRELRPILRMKWNGVSEPLQPALVALDYHGQSYAITDPVGDSHGDMTLNTWNRDVFRLLTQLAGQASIDTSKFPLPTSLQVSPGQ
jgi:hypothetical protein